MNWWKIDEYVSAKSVNQMKSNDSYEAVEKVRKHDETRWSIVRMSH
jgi:hypothetical protein